MILDRGLRPLVGQVERREKALPLSGRKGKLADFVAEKQNGLRSIVALFMKKRPVSIFQESFLARNALLFVVLDKWPRFR